MTLRRRNFLSLLAGTAVLLPGFANAQAYPSRPVRLVVGFAPGGTTDAIARLVSRSLSERLGQQFVVDNRPGASGNIATASVAGAAPDGYTLLIGNQGTEPNLGLIPVAQLATTSLVLVATPSLQARSLTDIVSVIRRRPSQVSYSSAGEGSTGHYAGEMFKSAYGLDMHHVSYRGLAPAMSDLIAGRIELTFADIGTCLPQIRGGSIRAIAITGRQRSPDLPEIPTIAELGTPAFDVTVWSGLFAPAGTPDQILTQLRSTAANALSDRALEQSLRAMFFEPGKLTGQDFVLFVRNDLKSSIIIQQPAPCCATSPPSCTDKRVCN